jgi:hypothetical protein
MAVNSVHELILVQTQPKDKHCGSGGKTLSYAQVREATTKTDFQQTFQVVSID